MVLTEHASIRRTSTLARDPEAAAAELFDGLYQDEIAVAVFFASRQYDLEELQSALSRRFEGIPLIGCTTAGEIGPDGYHTGGLTGFSLSGKDFAVVTSLIPDLKDMPPDTGKSVAQQAKQQHEGRGLRLDAGNCFGFLLVDGLSVREEVLVDSLHKPLGDIHLFGGSAGDDLEFKRTLVWHGNRFHENAAVFSLVHTELPFEVFRSQHFVATEKKLVVTEADPATRIVSEINGDLAAIEYANLVGVKVEDLSPDVFSQYPVVLRAAGELFVRSIAKANPDHSLTLFCAIEKGMVLTLAKAADLTQSLRETFEGIEERLGRLQLVVGCDCILRRLECESKGILDQVGGLMNRYAMVGFATYGEQYDSMHVNQTLTGVALGSRIRHA